MQSLSIPAATDGHRIWLRVGTLLDGVSLTPLRNAHIVYDRKEIRYVGENSPPAELLAPNQRQPDLDLPDGTLLPGLIEAHAHFFLEGGELNADKRAAYLKQTPEELLKLAQPRLEKLVRLGIIAVRDAGDKDGVGLAIAKMYNRAGAVPVFPLSSPKGGEGRGEVALDSPDQIPSPRLGGERESKTVPGCLGTNRPLMPYVDSPGAAIHHQGRYGSFMADPLENYGSLEKCVEARVKAGAYRIKLIPTGIINFKKGAVTAEPQMTTEEVSRLVAAAKSFGKQTFAHASGDTGIDRVLDGGADSVEHGFFVRDDQLAKMRDRQIAWVPTFAPVQEQVDHADIMGWDAEVVGNLNAILDQHAASLVKGHQMGVQIIAGSDAGSYGVAHGLGFYYELELMERAGLSPLVVINAATGAPSNRLGFGEKFGQIKAGYQSRFILTRHSPLETVSNLRKHKWVVFDGEVLETGESPDTTGL
ncbi:MAG TPA: amidohydrolase family protein [Verrucomicrobiae bacterium]|jgi:imidazolonepropionase-like amidohydrolase